MPASGPGAPEAMVFLVLQANLGGAPENTPAQRCIQAPCKLSSLLLHVVGRLCLRTLSLIVGIFTQ